MIFIDESGDDGNSEKSAQMFFVVSAYFSSLEEAKKENIKIRNFLKYKKINLKWFKLRKEQRLKFEEYIKNITYKIDYVYSDKKVDHLKYAELLEKLLVRNNINNQQILYKGEHMVNMFTKILRKIKRTKTIKTSHREIIKEEEVGIEIADLWAGYVNTKLNKGN